MSTPRTPRSIGAGPGREYSRRALTTTTIRKMDRQELEEELRDQGATIDEDDTDQQLRDQLCDLLDAQGDGPPAPAKRTGGGPSGRNVNPRRKLAAPPEAWELMDRAAERAIESWSEWARGKLALAVADELKLEPEEMIALFDRE